MSEDQIQSKVITHFHNNHPETRFCIWHVPNGGSRNQIEANRLKALGVVPGIEDVHFFWNGKVYFIEFKDDTGSTSPFQKAAHAAHARQGGSVYLIRDPEIAIALISSIIEGISISRFDTFLSPYAKAEMYSIYETEAREYRNRLKKSSSRRKKF